MDEILMSLDNVSRYYGEGRRQRVALSDISCQVMTSDRVAILGPSGSGKSTLIHLMAGLDKPTRGTVNWPALGPESELRPDQICVVFQTPSLLPTLNVVENVELSWLLSKKDAASARSAALGTLEKLGLSTLHAKLPEELSGGQMQRVAVARAIVCEPRLILADEPTGQLDSVSASKLIKELCDSAANSGAALIVATHDIAIADRMETQWHMNRGRFEQRQSRDQPSVPSRK
jgi:putative ABC transport system ATP-binding protein/lipoprotein-releasing system ATP-binding protein